MSSAYRHIPFDRLVDLVEGRLTVKGQEQAQSHVSACAQCSSEVVWLEEIIGLMRDNPAQPPPYVIAYIKDLFHSQMTLSDGLEPIQSEQVRQGWIGSLPGDSASQE